MLKGCQKKIIMVKDANSRYFESAYFVIKSDLPPSAREDDMLAEAHRLIADYSSEIASQNSTSNNVQPQKPHQPAHHITLGVIFALALVGIAAAVIVTL